MKKVIFSIICLMMIAFSSCNLKKSAPVSDEVTNDTVLVVDTVNTDSITADTLVLDTIAFDSIM